MNVLMVDDQVSVLNGLEAGVRFQEIGVDREFYAIGSEEAKSILQTQNIDILLSDIEMPGENGITLIKWVMQNYPEVLCIMLTSHADFHYAHESIHMGCFDYILQPAPYEQIEDCLRRAMQELYERRKREQIYRFGQMMKTNETEMISQAVSNLYSRVEEDRENSLTLLNAVGYPLRKTTPIRLVIVHAENFSVADAPTYSEKFIHKAIREAVKAAGITYPMTALTNMVPNKEFCLMLFSVNQEEPVITSEMFRNFYTKLSELMKQDNVMCYVGESAILQKCREEYHVLQETMVEENIARRPGLYFHSGQRSDAGTTANLSDSILRWKTFLESGKSRMLEAEIDEFIRNTEENSRSKYRDLCELHQQLTHIFFSYLYENKADVSSLFTREFTYTNYMDSFASAGALQKAVQYMLRAIEHLQKKDVPESDVEKARSYIVENIANPITVADVAEHVNLNAEYFTKLFKKETGQNIKEYIMQSKIAAAKDLLEHSNMSVSMVAMELGYSNFSHFTQVFKKSEDCTPSEYRSNYREKKKSESHQN